MTVRRLLAALAVVSAAAAASAPTILFAKPKSPNVTASRYEVRLDVQQDGSVDVAERISLRIGETPITWFERKVSDRRTDGITNVVAMIAGRELPRVESGEGVRVRSGSGLDVRWQFFRVANTTLVFELRYRAVRVITRSVEGLSLRWTALPSRHDYPIDAARIDIRVPPGVMTGEFSVTGGDLQPPSTVEGNAAVLVATASRLARNETVTLDVGFVPGTFSPVEPEWQVAGERVQEMMPAFLTAGATVLVIGIATVWMVWFRSRRSPDVFAGDAVPPRPVEEDELPPALASMLLNRGQTTGWLSLQAAFFRLVRDGQLIVEKRTDGTWFRSAAFTVRLGTSGSAAPHEQWLIDAVARGGAGADLKRLTARFIRRQRGFSAVLHADAMARGYIEGDRLASSRGLWITGLVLVLFAVVGLAVLGLWFGRLGPALHALPGALLIDGVLFVIAGHATSVLSDAGVLEAARWKTRAAMMRETVRRRGEVPSLKEFERWLPLGIGIGIGGRWLKTFDAQLRAEGSEIAWLKAIGSPADVRASLAMMIAISGATQAGSGGGAAGAAGGGSSAAG